MLLSNLLVMYMIQQYNLWKLLANFSFHETIFQECGYELETTQSNLFALKMTEVHVHTCLVHLRGRVKEEKKKKAKWKENLVETLGSSSE